MVVALAGNAILNTAQAEIKVTLITGAAVVVLIWNGTFAVIAVNREYAGGRGSRETSVVANSILTFVVDASKLSKPSITGNGATVNGDFGAVAIHLRGLLVSLQLTAAGAGD